MAMLLALVNDCTSVCMADQAGPCELRLRWSSGWPH